MSFSWSVVFVSQAATYAVAGRSDETALLTLGQWLLASLGGRGPAPLSRSRAAVKVAPRPASRTMLPPAFLPWQAVQLRICSIEQLREIQAWCHVMNSFLSKQGSICNLRYLSQNNSVLWLGSLKGRRSRCLEVWRRIVWYTGTNVAEKRSAFIFSPDYLRRRFSCTIGIYYQAVTALHATGLHSSWLRHQIVPQANKRAWFLRTECHISYLA